jgi:hypothetical protein
MKVLQIIGQRESARFLLYKAALAGDDEGGAAGTGGGSDGTILNGGAAGGQEAFEIPEKFLVKMEDGQPDYKGTLEKMGVSYLSLEKRMGAGEAPPETPDKYKLETFLPEGYEVKPEAIQPILAKFHEVGLNNKQVQSVMNIFGERLTEGLAAEKAGHEAGMKVLSEKWGDKFDDNVHAANAFVAAYGDDEERKILTDNPKYANDPVLLNIFAKAGMELHREDNPANEGGAVDGETLDSLTSHPAYMDSKHPEHRNIKAKVNALYAKGAKRTK